MVKNIYFYSQLVDEKTEFLQKEHAHKMGKIKLETKTP